MRNVGQGKILIRDSQGCVIEQVRVLSVLLWFLLLLLLLLQQTILASSFVKFVHDNKFSSYMYMTVHELQGITTILY